MTEKKKSSEEIDWKKKLQLLKRSQLSPSVSVSTEKENETTREVPISKSNSLNQPIEIDKRERRVLKTVFRSFNDSRTKGSQSDQMSPMETSGLVILTSKFKFQTIMASIFGAFFIYLFWFLAFFLLPTIDDERAYGLGLTASGVRIAVSLLIILVIGIGGMLITFALKLRHYFIVLHYQGIYYKKIGNLKFIPWVDIARIVGYLRYVRGRPTERAVKIHLKSRNVVRFNSSNYLFKDKFIDFDDVFYSYQFRGCPFFSRDNNSYGTNLLGSFSI
ncbi:MAG: hypothetical protein ACW98D_19305 [Promethearchaeota archaeon]|jgi:hypothetical protein